MIAWGQRPVVGEKNRRYKAGRQVLELIENVAKLL
jgi:hypothetical protein